MKKILILLVVLLGTVAYTEKGSTTSRKSNEVNGAADKIRESIILPQFFEEAKNLPGKNIEETVAVEKTEYYESGKASFYGGKWHGRKTANGEIFDTYTLTAAHKSLPFGTKVKVTNLDNGKSVVVRINNRGPYIKGRIIDLSTAAFSSIENVNKGVTSVKLEILK